MRVVAPERSHRRDPRRGRSWPCRRRSRRGCLRDPSRRSWLVLGCEYGCRGGFALGAGGDGSEHGDRLVQELPRGHAERLAAVRVELRRTSHRVFGFGIFKSLQIFMARPSSISSCRGTVEIALLVGFTKNRML